MPSLLDNKPDVEITLGCPFEVTYDPVGAIFEPKVSKYQSYDSEHHVAVRTRHEVRHAAIRSSLGFLHYSLEEQFMWCIVH